MCCMNVLYRRYHTSHIHGSVLSLSLSLSLFSDLCLPTTVMCLASCQRLNGTCIVTGTHFLRTHFLFNLMELFTYEQTQRYVLHGVTFVEHCSHFSFECMDVQWRLCVFASHYMYIKIWSICCSLLVPTCGNIV